MTVMTTRFQGGLLYLGGGTAFGAFSPSGLLEIHYINVGGFSRRLGRFRTPLLLIATSMAFSIWHLAPNMLVHTFLVSLLFGSAYLRSGRLLPVALGHTLTNMLGGLGMLAGWW